MSEFAKRIDEIDQERQRLFKAKEPIDTRLMELYEERRHLQEKLSSEWIKEMGDSPDWPMIIRVRGMDDSPLASARLLNYSDEKLAAMGMHGGGYSPETSQMHLQVMLTKGSPSSYERTLAAVRMFLPMLKPMKDGYIHLGIFEHSLSQYGVYDLRVLAKGLDGSEYPEFIVGRRTYGSWRQIKRFDKLEEALLYIQEHHWYDGGQTHEEDDD